MDTHGTATLGQFAELASVITRALPKATEGLDIKEILRLANVSGERLSDLLCKVLTSLDEPTEESSLVAVTAPTLPTEFTIDDRTYELIPFLKEGESYVSGDTVVERAKELNANLGQEEGQFILEHQEEIPRVFRGKFFLVFTGWRNPTNPQDVASLDWNDYHWYQGWRWLVSNWYEDGRLVRCRT